MTSDFTGGTLICVRICAACAQGPSSLILREITGHSRRNATSFVTIWTCADHGPFPLLSLTVLFLEEARGAPVISCSPQGGASMVERVLSFSSRRQCHWVFPPTDVMHPRTQTCFQSGAYTIELHTTKLSGFILDIYKPLHRRIPLPFFTSPVTHELLLAHPYPPSTVHPPRPHA